MPCQVYVMVQRMLHMWFFYTRCLKCWSWRVQAATDALQTETMEMGKAMYSQPGASGADPSAAGGAPGGDAGSSGGGATDNVVDAEFTESDDKK
jgi:hypothetical protein